MDGWMDGWSINKKLSYRRETARQLPTWKGGLGPPAHLIRNNVRSTATSIHSYMVTMLRQVIEISNDRIDVDMSVSKMSNNEDEFKE